jgi:TRAP-type C4-dicarboxylate transport system permease small subunit
MKLEKVVSSGIPTFCGALLVIVVSLTFLQIVLRQFFDFPLYWSDEVSQFCMSWFVLFGSIWATKNNLHLNTGLKLHQKLNKKQICLIDGILELAIAIVTAVIAYQGAIFAFSAMKIESLSLPWLKTGYVFTALPLVMLVLCYYYMKSFIKKVLRMFKRDKE